MNNKFKIALASGVACVLAVSSFAAGSLISIDVDPSIKILVNGEEFHPKDANGNDVMTFTYNGTTYAPLRALAEAYGLEVGYDPDRKMATVGGSYVPETTPPPEETYEHTPTMGEKNALESAKSYLRYSSYSYKGLVERLEREDYTNEEAVYGADNCGADWNEQALEAAESYLRYSSYSYKGVYDRLIREDFTKEQALYGADNCGADWNEQAVNAAKSYLKYSSYSYEGVYDRLIREDFTEEQALYGVDNCGADWYEQAVNAVKSYLEYNSYSRQGLYERLKRDGFTDEQAEYGVTQNGY